MRFQWKPNVILYRSLSRQEHIEIATVKKKSRAAERNEVEKTHEMIYAISGMWKEWKKHSIKKIKHKNSQFENRYKRFSDTRKERTPNVFFFTSALELAKKDDKTCEKENSSDGNEMKTFIWNGWCSTWRCSSWIFSQFGIIDCLLSRLCQQAIIIIWKAIWSITTKAFTSVVLRFARLNSE